MINKIAMYVLDSTLRATCILGLLYFCGVIFFEPPMVKLEEDPRWCFYAEYADMDSFEVAERPQTVFINMAGSTVRVFAHCESIYEKENN